MWADSTQARVVAMKPFLRWAGSKRQILPRLAAYYPNRATRYIEPFCGSAALFLMLNPQRAVLGDLNSELVVTLRALQTDADLVLAALRRLPVGKSCYYKIREISPDSLSAVECAARFLYLNHYCFNGLYRTNQAGRFNVPYGPPRSGRPLDEATVLAAADLLRNALIVEGDFAKTLKHVRAGDFVYLDPPFAVDNRRIFREYLPHSFAAKDLTRLSEALHQIAANGAHFLMSYADSPEARRLVAPWRHVRVPIRRHIAGFAGARRRHYELLATNQGIGA